jgi:hypothetical protein
VVSFRALGTFIALQDFWTMAVVMAGQRRR